ncbi:hypothetical protein L1987_53307 [Smallanthus sonchifolius]|uniref:Uncharacterized protein n=1 Tax=Smallanthus sonchifolius TaxID=185202 RepID=A0ACB9EVV9_9ASTR|nr:hypothetical protein L1987_53307 [Smallanthus sonchifolius]
MCLGSPYSFVTTYNQFPLTHTCVCKFSDRGLRDSETSSNFRFLHLTNTKLAPFVDKSCRFLHSPMAVVLLLFHDMHFQYHKEDYVCSFEISKSTQRDCQLILVDGI